MHDQLAKALSLGVALFVFISMFNLGLDLTIRQITEPLRNRRLLARALGANFLLVPAAAFVLTWLIPVDPSVRVGLLLYFCCVGSEAAPKFVQLAKGDAALAVALLGFFLPLTVFGVPPLLALGFPDVHIAQGLLVLKLALVIVLPMGVGLWIRAQREALALRWSKVIHKLASLILLMIFLLLIYIYAEQFLAQQATTLLAGLVTFAAAFVIGHRIAGPNVRHRRAFAIMTVTRGGSISMMIAGQAFPLDPTVLVIATIMTGMSVIITVTASLVLQRIPVRD